MENLCSLRFQAAAELIKDRQQVYYRHGVWNEYERKNTADVIPRILGSGYGADVYEKDGELFVSIPNNSDMW